MCESFSPHHVVQRPRFRPKTFKLHVRDGDKSNGNIGCDPEEALKPLNMYRVKIQLRDTRVAVYVNDEQVCTSAREDRSVYKKAIVYAADPYVRMRVDLQDVYFFPLAVRFILEEILFISNNIMIMRQVWS